MYNINEKLHNEIYEKLVSLFGIKFKVQLNNSPIEFKKLFFVKNLITDIEFYSLIFDSKTSIQFENREEFLTEFIQYLKSNVKELEEEYEYLNSLDFGAIKYDENYIYNRHEHIGHGTYKLNQIIEKLKKYQ
ncbi:hypothetical protein [Empedobacter brevis]|uniref:hypothetical protein n=1 Tax=Empedobacter brevis TaxID=247 RepID=UPI003341C70E